MFCKNCGEKLNDNQVICIKCGVKVGDGEQHCYNCGKEIMKDADVCLNCGVALKKNSTIKGENNLNGQDKTKMALICFFLGGLGIHNFMMGEKKKGMAKILLALLFGASGIFALIDFIKILLDKYEYDPEALF